MGKEKSFSIVFEAGGNNGIKNQKSEFQEVGKC